VRAMPITEGSVGMSSSLPERPDVEGLLAEHGRVLDDIPADLKDYAGKTTVAVVDLCRYVQRLEREAHHLACSRRIGPPADCYICRGMVVG
jgi:hypothetical protein